MENADSGNELAGETASSIEIKMNTYEERKEHLEGLKKKMKDAGKKQLTIVDSDSRAMKNNGKIDIAYNMQSAVDSKHRFIVALNVVNDITDQSQLFPMTTLINNILSLSTERIILADTGYYNAEQIKKCIDNDNSLYLKPQRAKSANGNPEYSKNQFQYQKETDTYLCPKGKELPLQRTLPRMD